MSSVYFTMAASLRAEARAAFEDYRWSAYERAADACREALLNERGRRARVDPYSLFMGNRTRAYAYASDELKEHWASHRRPVFADFERQHFQAWENGAIL